MTSASLKKYGVVLVMAVAILAPSLAFAAAEDASASPDPVPSEDHWSVFSALVPETTIRNMRYMWGGTVMGDEAPARVKHIFMGVVVFIFSLFMGFLAAKKFAKQGDEAVLPERKFNVFTFFDLAGEWLYGLMVQTMGKKHAHYFFPYIMSLAIFILFSNLLGMVPGFLPPTDNLDTTLALASTVFIVTHVYGVKEHGAGPYFAHFMGPMRSLPWLPLMILMLLIEIISHIARPLSLAIRLMGNMFADHAVLGVFLSFGILLLPLPVMALGTLVCIVQTLVFCLLSIVYIALAVEHSEEH